MVQHFFIDSFHVKCVAIGMESPFLRARMRAHASMHFVVCKENLVRARGHKQSLAANRCKSIMNRNENSLVRLNMFVVVVVEILLRVCSIQRSLCCCCCWLSIWFSAIRKWNKTAGSTCVMNREPMNGMCVYACVLITFRSIANHIFLFLFSSFPLHTLYHFCSPVCMCSCVFPSFALFARLCMESKCLLFIIFSSHRNCTHSNESEEWNQQRNRKSLVEGNDGSLNVNVRSVFSHSFSILLPFWDFLLTFCLLSIFVCGQVHVHGSLQRIAHSFRKPFSQKWWSANRPL